MRWLFPSFHKSLDGANRFLTTFLRYSPPFGYRIIGASTSFLDLVDGFIASRSVHKRRKLFLELILRSLPNVSNRTDSLEWMKY